jgi:hypothetical protein
MTTLIKQKEQRRQEKGMILSTLQSSTPHVVEYLSDILQELNLSKNIREKKNQILHSILKHHHIKQ